MANLGIEGNAHVAACFEEYTKRFPRGSFSPNMGERRVLLTGFGLFSGVPYNISGVVANAFVGGGFRPIPEYGALAASRVFEHNGERVVVGALLLNVMWDLASAIILHEAMSFNPDLILMTGLGSDDHAFFETGALNQATLSPGFDSLGFQLGSESGARQNQPVSSLLHETKPQDHSTSLSWNAEKAYLSSKKEIAELGFEAQLTKGPRPSNTYICNNVSYDVGSAIESGGVALAGGKIQLESSLKPATTKVGFFHYPKVTEKHPRLNSYSEGVTSWCKVIQKMIYGALE